MKSADHDIVIKINGDLARDSSLGAKMNAGYEYSDWYYVNNGHNFNLEHQRICAQKTIDRLGLDVDTAVKVQNAVIHAYQMADRMLDVRETIQRHHLIASEMIRGEVLNHPPKQTPVPVQVTVPVSQTIPTKQIKQNEYIAEFASQFGMDEINSDILLTRLKTSTGDWPTRESKNIVKGHYTHWFDQNYTMGGNNPKILDVRCIKIFEAPKDHNLTLLTLTNYVIDDSYSPYIANMLRGNYCPNLQVFNLSNNHFTDSGVRPIADAVGSGGTPSLKGLDFHGNKLTGTGYSYFAKALENPKTQDIAITMEVHAGKNAVIDFLKKGSSYYFQEFVKNFKNNIDTQYIKTDEDSAFMHCKKGVPNAVVGVTLGVAKCTNPIAKIINSLPQSGEKISFTTKAVNKLGLFACIMSEEGDNIVTPDLLGCASEIHEQLNDCVIF